ncbi:MAG: homocysteine S-methyltransferase family protein [Deltaproteobacteria bacterium]|nr:homocysteine S-methyltransferase family protein [Deltaproteobacteria bacterium]MBW2480298.1 homocysteine S-methyltransferase family protein [Deltaproteobacteria bacterium]
MSNPILEIVKDRPLLFDGAMGTMLMKAGKVALKTPILLNLDEPDLVTDIHRQYYAAGADVAITNTFGGSPLKLVADGLEEQMAALNRAAVKLARQACPDGKYVGGDIGPSGKMLKPLGDAAPEDVQASFFSQAEVLIEGGVDLIIIETMFSLEEALAAVRGVKKAGDILLLASMTYTKTPNGFFTMMGETVSQCTAALEEAGADMTGANCTLNSTDTIDLTKELRAATDRPILIQPNAGKPVTSEGVTYYEQTPAEFAADARKIHAAGADMIGGCCGTTPEFIKAVKELLADG